MPRQRPALGRPLHSSFSRFRRCSGVSLVLLGMMRMRTDFFVCALLALPGEATDTAPAAQTEGADKQATASAQQDAPAMNARRARLLPTLVAVRIVIPSPSFVAS